MKFLKTSKPDFFHGNDIVIVPISGLFNANVCLIRSEKKSFKEMNYSFYYKLSKPNCFLFKHCNLLSLFAFFLLFVCIFFCLISYLSIYNAMIAIWPYIYKLLIIMGKTALDHGTDLLCKAWTHDIFSLPRLKTLDDLELISGFLSLALPSGIRENSF